MICRYKPYTEQWIGKIIDPMDLPMGYLAQVICWKVRDHLFYHYKYIMKRNPRIFDIFFDIELKNRQGSWTLDSGPYWNRNDGQCKVQIIRKLTP